MFDRTALLQAESMPSRRTLSRRFSETFLQVHLSPRVCRPPLSNKWVVMLLIRCTAYTP